MLVLGSKFPNFTANTTIGEIDFYNWLGNSWGILFSHPADFTPVCTTELSMLNKLMPEFTKRNVKVIALSIDSVAEHQRWCQDILFYGQDNSHELAYPIIADEDRDLAIRFNMIDKDEQDSVGMYLAARAVFIIDPSKKFRLSILYPASTGRNFREVLRVLDSLQLVDKHRVSTPANWEPGTNVLIDPRLSEQTCTNMFPDHVTLRVPSERNYIRFTPQPE